MASDTLIGRALDEFVLREQIGQGATSVVYLADQPLLERQVVVKLSRHERGAESQGFLREARLASRIEHPFAAHIYGFGVEQDGLHWIAMERVRGTPLTDFIAQGPMDPEIAIPFVRRLCDVIHAAHELGVIHRDIKPDNTMVVSRGGTLFPKLLDLGVALDQRAGAAGSVGRRQGTPAYMAPECWVDPKFASVASDVYALGVLTYELLAGKRPFVAAKLHELAWLHAREEPAPLPEAVPERARNAVYKALAKRATDRYQTVQAFADALIETSGVSMDVVGLPRLDELTLAAATSELPQPIADAVVLFDSAQTAQRALRASHGLLTTLSQVAGVVALAAADRLGAGHQSDAPLIQQLLSALQTRSLTPQEWWKLAREVCRPFAASPDVFPVPELVRMMFDDATQLTTAMDEWLVAAAKVVVAETSGDTRAGSTVTTTSSRAADAARTYLLGAMPAMSATLRSLQWLSRYRLATPSETGQARIWMGTRTLAGKFAATKAPVRHPCLLTAHDTIAVRLAPYVREAEPAAGEPAELFWVDGPGRADGEARHRALPQPYTMDAHGTWQAAGDSGSLQVDDSPYMGLLTFSEADSRRYFGREKEVDAFVNRLRKLPWIAVAGPSGVGKSSFIRAGVLPSLDNAQRIVMRPGPTPLATLRATLEQHGVHMREHYLREADALARALLARITEAGWGTLVLVVDQFEELVTQCLDPAEQEQFAKLLVTLARDADSPLRIVLTVRDDFLVRVAGLSALRNVISANLQLLTTPAKEDLLRIVIEPARRAGFEFEDDEMPAAMVDEVAAMPGALAMLSFTCSKLWQLRDRDARRLTRAAYKSLGGVGGALAQHAESLLIAMPEAEQATVREVFRHLVSADGTRAALSRKELVQVAGGAAAESVIEALINGRLLLASEDAGGERVEVVHETLIINWPRLVTWRAQDAETARLRDQLRVAAKQWKERGGDKGLLWRGDALTEYQLWRSRYPGRLTDLEEEFGRQSIAAGKLRKKLTIGALATLLTAMTVAMVIFYGLRTKAVASQKDAEKQVIELRLEQARKEWLEGQPLRAAAYLRYAIEKGVKNKWAFRLADLVLNGMRHLKSVVEQDSRVLVVEAALGGYASGNEAGVVFVSLGGNRALSVNTSSTVRQIEISELLKLVVVRNDSNTIFVIDATSGSVIRNLIVPGNLLPTAIRLVEDKLWVGAEDGSLWATDLLGYEFVSIGKMGEAVAEIASLDAASVAILGADGTMKFWNAQLGIYGGAESGPIYTPEFVHQHVAYDDSWLLVGTRDGAVRVYSRALNWAESRVLRGNDRPISAIAACGNGVFATGGADGRTILWDASNGALLRSYDVHGGVAIYGLLCRDHRLFSYGADGSIQIANESGWLGRLDGHQGAVAQVALLENGDIVSVGYDRTLRQWTGELPIQIANIGGNTRGTRITSITRRIFVAGEDGIRIFNRSGVEQMRLRGKDLNEVAISPDESLVAATGEDGTLTVFEGASFARVRVLEDHKTAAYSLVFSLDGRELITAGEDGTVHWWNTTNWKIIRREAHGGLPGEQSVSGLAAANHNATWTGGDDRYVRKWLREKDSPAVAVKVGAAVNVVIPSPDGEKVFVALEDGSSWLYTSDMSRQLMAIGARGSNVNWAVFTPQGDIVLTASLDGKIRMYASDNGRLIGTYPLFKVPAYSIDISRSGDLVVVTSVKGHLATMDLALDDSSSISKELHCSTGFKISDGELVEYSRPGDCQ